MGRFNDFAVRGFGGLNEEENQDTLGAGELREAINCWVYGGSIGTRPGTALDTDVYTSAVAGAAPIRGICDYRLLRDTVRKMLVVTNAKIYSGPATEVTKDAGVVLTNAAGKPWTFAQHKQIVFAAGGDVSTDKPWYYTNAGNVTLLPMLNLSDAQVSPRYIMEFSNRLFASGFNDIDASANSGVVRYSALNDGLTWPKGNTLGGASAVGGFGAQADVYVTGCASFTDNSGRYLIVMTPRSCFALREDSDPLVTFRITDDVANGCVNQLAWVNLGVDAGDAVYCSPYGIHSLRQSQAHGGKIDTFLSYKIRKTFETINRSRMDQITGTYWNQHGLVLFAVPTGSSTVNDTILALDVRQTLQAGNARDLNADNARWYIWRLSGTNHGPCYLAPGRTVAGAPTVYVGDYKGNVCTLQPSSCSDLGESYSVKFRTKDSYLENPTVEKQMGDLFVDLRPGGSYEPSLRVLGDWGSRVLSTHSLSMEASGSPWTPDDSWDPITAWAAPATTHRAKVYGSGAANTIGFEFSHAAASQPFYIDALFGQVALEGEGVEA